MFQPWTMALYRIGFFALLFSTLAFIVWSHIAPATVRRDEHPMSTLTLKAPFRSQK